MYTGQRPWVEAQEEEGKGQGATRNPSFPNLPSGTPAPYMQLMHR
jgi:hypothetical protein